MADPFVRCLAFTLREEGGWSDDPEDPGGMTNHGLTMADLSHWDRAATVDTLRSISPDLVAALYRAHYWQPIRGWALWPGLDLMLFDAGVNAGVGTAIMQLQHLLHVTVDGAMGPITAQAARAAANRPAFLLALHALQVSAYRAMAKFDRFGADWLARCERRYEAGRQLAETSGAIA